MQEVLLSQIGLKILQENDILIIRQSNLWRFIGMVIVFLIFYLIAYYLDDPSININIPPLLFIFVIIMAVFNGKAPITVTIDRQQKKITEHKAQGIYVISCQKEYDMTDIKISVESPLMRSSHSCLVISPDMKNHIEIKTSIKTARKIQLIINAFLALDSKS
ncbi:MAG: hypothetical protein KGV46_01485 [Pasteurella sp.]|nr:hypothetical protein [Pasteurella sp.]